MSNSESFILQKANQAIFAISEIKYWSNIFTICFYIYIYTKFYKFCFIQHWDTQYFNQCACIDRGGHPAVAVIRWLITLVVAVVVVVVVVVHRRSNHQAKLFWINIYSLLFIITEYRIFQLFNSLFTWSVLVAWLFYWMRQLMQHYVTC